MLRKNLSVVDLLGIAASLACALHCLMGPLLFIAMPYFGNHLFGGVLTHHALVIASTFFCLLSIYLAAKNNGNPKTLILFITGLVCLFTATFFLPKNLHGQYELYILAVGSLALISGHAINFLNFGQCCE